MSSDDRSHAARTLRVLLRDTLRALQELADIIHIEPEILSSLQQISEQAARPAALVILGTSAAARARLLHYLLGRKLLPDDLPRGCKWIRVQYGTASTTQVHLTLGNSEFELVEELECNKRKWDTLPVEDLIRQDHIDLATMLDVELNVPFLKHNPPIIIPPDIDADVSSHNLQTLKQTYSEFYSKRDLILRNFNPVYLCAIDRIGDNIFSDNFMPPSISETRSEEDFWNLFNFYNMSRSGCDQANGDGETGDVNGPGDEREDDNCEEVPLRRPRNERLGPPVFNSENCLDLHQMKDMNPHAAVLFAVLADSRAARERRRARDEATESADSADSAEDVWYAAEDLPEADRELLRDGAGTHAQESSEPNSSTTDPRRLKEKQIAFMSELLDQWELMSPPAPKHCVKSQSLIIEDREHSPAAAAGPAPRARADHASVAKHCADCKQAYVLHYCTRLSEVHLKLLQQFILASFDMARQLQVLPRKIQYVATQEKQLYETIYEKFFGGEKKQELLKIMQEVLKEMRNDVNNMDWTVDDLPCHQDPRMLVSNSVFYRKSRRDPLSGVARLFGDSTKSDVSGLSDVTGLSDLPCQWPPRNSNRNPLSGVAQLFGESGNSDLSGLSDVSVMSGLSDEQGELSDGEEAVSCDYNFDDYDIVMDHNVSGSESFWNKAEQEEPTDMSSPVSSIRIENELYTSNVWSTIFRSGWGHSRATSTVCTNANNISVKQASLDVQQTVLAQLSKKISQKLVVFLDCLQDSYFGTLQRCLSSLESVCRRELGGRPASEAMRQLLSVARQVDLQPCASFSLLRSLAESLRRLLYKLLIVGDEADDACCVMSSVWRRQVALQTTASLSPQRLARVISVQILERLREAHEKYQSALTSLESALTSRLHHAQESKLAIRKTYAPSFARLCLESTSLCDLLMHGTPELGREIGRGQYGVVYAVKGGWGGRSPAAVKSVLPADKRHYHELAMEFFYTRSIPAHPRIVRLFGSVVQRHSGAGPVVLLVTERKARDLHCAVRQGLAYSARMRISCDIVEGIRYLHSFGLVHRDIKMKNVLLDAHDRAALSDLGFCAAEALITGSVVGTPIHMAPELMGREYDASVDVYAFGILFWYVCAGSTKLPSAFECQNKEQLWSKVKKGLRPERLPQFSDECWEVMSSCWAAQPARRAHLGDVQSRLRRLHADSLRAPPPPPPPPRPALSDDDSYSMGTDRGLLDFDTLHAH